MDRGSQFIFNSDKGSQFTSVEFTDCLKVEGIQISMDGRGRSLDNIFVERQRQILDYQTPQAVYVGQGLTGGIRTLCAA